VSIKTPEDLFVHELEDMYDAEQQILKALPKLAQEARDDKLREAIEHHEVETHTQIQNLEKVFQSLGHQAESTTCYGIKGLIQEHEHFVAEQPAPEVLQLFNIGAASKTEQYEICSYTDLITEAQLLGHDDAVSLLRENLKHEQEMAKKLEEVNSRVSSDTIKQLQPA